MWSNSSERHVWVTFNTTGKLSAGCFGDVSEHASRDEAIQHARDGSRHYGISRHMNKYGIVDFGQPQQGT